MFLPKTLPRAFMKFAWVVFFSRGWDTYFFHGDMGFSPCFGDLEIFVLGLGLIHDTISPSLRFLLKKMWIPFPQVIVNFIICFHPKDVNSTEIRATPRDDSLGTLTPKNPIPHAQTNIAQRFHVVVFFACEILKQTWLADIHHTQTAIFFWCFDRCI